MSLQQLFNRVIPGTVLNDGGYAQLYNFIKPFLRRRTPLGRSLALLFIVGIVMAGCQENEGKGQGEADSLALIHNGKMPVDCTLCKEPSRSALLMGDGASGAGIDSSQLGSVLASASDTTKMVLIQGGSFQMGATEFPDALPVHRVSVSSFYMDVHEVTNAQFAKFVQETNYQTVAERPLNPKDFPGVPVDKLVPGSGVFTPPNHPVSLDNPMAWWTYVPGANWRHPTGPNSSIKGKENYPVVQICYEDCLAYAKWAGKRLPTEAEWEYAARAGKQYKQYYWGTELTPGGKHMANIFQGHFPDHNTKADGYDMLAPVGQYPANAFGLYDMEGNAWEWCQDFYRPDYYANSPDKDPQGPADSYDPMEPGVVKRVQRGGSFLCSDQYCIRYKAGSRGKGEPTSASNNLGFRLVKSVQ